MTDQPFPHSGGRAHSTIALMPPRIRPARPRFVADLVPAALTLALLGIPSLTFAATAYDAVFFLFGIQHVIGAEDAGTVVQALRLTINVAAAIGIPVAFAWRAARPVLSTSVIAVLALAHFFAGTLLMPVDLLIFGSVYSLTVYGPTKWSRAGLILALAGGVLISVSGYFPGRDQAQVFILLILLALSSTLVLLSWGGGLLRRSRLEQRESLRERAMRLERERDQQAQIATVAERNRIAREMHDIVAHSLSVVVAQADGGRYAAATDPSAAATALETIAETSRAALADMRKILGVLREDDTGSPDTTPQPVHTDLDTLIEQVQAAGLDVTRITVGTPRPLPSGAGVAVYRIVQESLTNILKHAGPAVTATITTAWTKKGLDLTVEDDGRGAATTSDGAGHGLVGMKERAQMLGGTLSAGPRPGGGFRIHAHIPRPR